MIFNDNAQCQAMRSCLDGKITPILIAGLLNFLEISDPQTMLG